MQYNFKINFIQPFSLDSRFGVELNRCISNMTDDDWVCVMDLDCMLLHHSQVPMMYEYIARYPDTGLFLARSNRSGSQVQRFEGQVSKNSDMMYWLDIAAQIKPTYKVTAMPLNKISGFLMLFSKKTWERISFSETLNILHIDRTFASDVLSLGLKIRIMDDLLVWHTYRLLNGTQDKSHLL